MMTHTLASLSCTNHLFGASWAASLWRATWQGGLALLLVWMICRAWPAVPPRLRVWLWRLAYLKLLVAWLWAGAVTLNFLPGLPRLPVPKLAAQPSPPATTLHQPATTVPLTKSAVKSAAKSSPKPAPTAAVLQPAGSPLPAQSAAHPWQWADLLPLLGVVWVLGVAWGVVRLLLSMRLVHRLRREGHPVGEEALLRLRVQMVKQMGLRKAPMLLAHPSEGPLLLGMVHPVIIVPEAMLAGNEEELQLALAHELAHVRRRDILWGWLPVVTELLFFFHPLVYLARREYRLAQEIATDAQALHRTGAAPKTYGAMLVNGAAFQAGYRPVPVAVGIMESYHILHRRLSAMRHLSPSTRQYMLAGILVCLLALVALVPWRLSAQEEALARIPHVPQLVPQFIGRQNGKLYVSLDNRHLYTLGRNGVVLCSMQNGLIEHASGSFAWVSDVVVGVDGRYAVYALGTPFPAVVWDLQEERIAARWPDSVTNLYPVSDNKRVWTVNNGSTGLEPVTKTLVLRELLTGKVIRSVPGITGDLRAISPNGSKAFTVIGETNQPGGKPSRFAGVIWDLATGKKITRLQWTKASVQLLKTPAQFTPDDSILAIKTETIDLWNTRTGAKVRTLTRPDPEQVGTISAMALSPDGKCVAAACINQAGGSIILWDLATGRRLAALNPGTPAGEIRQRTEEDVRRLGQPAPEYVPPPPTGEMIENLVYSADGKCLCYSMRHETGEAPAAKKSMLSVYCLDITEKKLRWVHEEPQLGRQARSAVLSKDNTKLAIFDSSVISVWDLTRGCLAREINLPDDMHVDYDNVLFTPDGTRLLASAQIERKASFPHYSPEPPREPAHLLVWDTVTGALLHDLPLQERALNRIAVSPDGTRAATCGMRAGSIILWNTADWSVVKRLDLPERPFVRAEFSPDGQWLAWTAAVINTAAPKNTNRFLYSTVSLLNLATGKITEHRTEATYDHMIFFSPDSRQLVVSRNQSDKDVLTFVLLDAATGREVVLEQPDFMKQNLRPHSLHLYYDQPARTIGCLFANPFDLSEGSLVTWDAGSGKIRRIEKRDRRYVGTRLLNTDPNIQVLCSYTSLNMTDCVTLVPLSQLQHERYPQVSATFRWFDGGQWLVTTADGYYDCTPDLAKNLAWKFNGAMYPYQQYEKQYHRPDLMRQALARQ